MTTEPRTCLLLHGAGMSPPSWQDVVTELGGRPLHAPWLRGLKPTQSGGFDLDAAVSELLTRLDLDDLERVDLCGVQLGGMVALRMAAQAPAKVGAVVVVDTPVVPSAAALRVQRTLMRLMPERAFAASGVTKAKALEAMSAMSGLDLSDDLGRVTAPVLVVASQGDRAAVAGAEVLRQRLASAETVELQGSSPLREQAGPLARAVTDFLDRSA